MASYSRTVLTGDGLIDSEQSAFYDARILYRDRAGEFATDKDKARKDLKSALDPFLKACFPDQPHQDPNPYYVLLHGDGDHMGAALGQKKSSKEHQDFSKDLSGFAARAREIVPKAGGSLVYAGGDDVMAFLPLHTALGCAKDLADAFADCLTGHTSPEGSPTLSVGLVIAHHLEPLADVLQWAREAESAAKKVYGRNALAVTLAKRGGVNITVGDHWDALVSRLQLFTDMHRLETIPDGAAYQLREIARDLAHIPKAAELEAQRVLGRKRSKDGFLLSKHTIQELQRCIEHGLQREITHGSKPSFIGLEGIANEIIIARLLADVADLAALPKPESRLDTEAAQEAS
jgi:CRISPR-associated protein Cmr2